MSYAILAFAVLLVIITIVYSISNSHKTESWRKTDSPKRTRRYIKEKLILENKYCSDLPNFDSRGIHCGANGSVTDKTGKFDPDYRAEMEELHRKYGIDSGVKK
jgi:hypothetical protein